MADSERDRLSFQRLPAPVALPSVKVADPGLQSFLDALKTAVEQLANGRGGLANQAITWGAAYRQGLVVLRDTQGNPIRPPGSPTPLPIEPPDGRITDIPPPAPAGVTASGGLGVILLSWNAPDARRVAYAEVFSADTDDIGAAVKIGETFGSADTIYRDVVGSAATRYYWVRYVGWGALALRGPFQSTAGVLGQTSADPSYVLGLLNGQISESQLAAALASRINLIDAPATTALSVNQRIQSGDDALAQQIALLTAGANQTFDQYRLWAFDASAENWTATNATLAWVAGWLTYTSPSGVVSLTSPTLTGADVVNGSAYQQVRFRVKRTAGTGWSATLRWFRSGAWYSASIADPTVAIGATETVLVDLAGNNNWVGQTITRVELQLDSATGSVYEIDWLAIGRDGPAASFAALQQEISARANADTAISQSVTTLSATVDGKASVAALQDEATVRASADGALYAQKFVKIDLDGFVTGYGIAASNNPATGTPESEFIARVNRFAIVPPTGSTGAASPFFYQATSTTINGVAVEPGLYVDRAFIANGSIGRLQVGLAAIDDARIADVTAGKLRSGQILVGQFISSSDYNPGNAGWRISGDGTAEFSAAVIRGQLVAAQINTNGLVIRDTNGTALFGAGVPLDWGRIINQPAGIYNANISIGPNGALNGAGGGQVTLGGLGAGALAFINQITAANAATYLGPNAITGNLIATGSITTNKLAAVPFVGNILSIDPGFEDDSAWALLNGTQYTKVVDSTTPFGRFAFTSSAAQCWLIGLKPIPISRDRVYRALCAAQSSAGGTRPMYLMVEFLDANLNTITGAADAAGWASAGTWHYFGVTGGVPPTTWTTFGQTFGAGQPAGIPVNARFVRLGALLTYDGGGSYTGSNRINGLRLVEVMPAELIVDGTITARKIIGGAVNDILTYERSTNKGTGTPVVITMSQFDNPVGAGSPRSAVNIGWTIAYTPDVDSKLIIDAVGIVGMFLQAGTTAESLGVFLRVATSPAAAVGQSDVFFSNETFMVLEPRFIPSNPAGASLPFNFTIKDIADVLAGVTYYVSIGFQKGSPATGASLERMRMTVQCVKR